MTQFFTEFFKEIAPDLATYGFLGLLFGIGFLYKKGYLSLTPQKLSVKESITREEFEAAMKALAFRIDDAANEASEAKASAQSAANNMENIAKIIQNSLENLGSRFDSAVAKLDSTVERAIDRLDNHEKRIATGEGITGQIEKRIERMENKS